MSVDQETEPETAFLMDRHQNSDFDTQAARCTGSRAKRMIDILGSLTGLIILSPALVLLALAIRFQDGGPVFFRQERTGLDGNIFRIWKFRTMRYQIIKTPFEQTRGTDDPRVTRLGRWLRTWSMDELPQLLNVLTGDMSLVGPRPHPVELDASLAPHFPSYALRYSVRPGLTGVAQVNDARGPITKFSEMQRRLEFDLHYIRNWSIASDITILFRTLKFLNSGKTSR